MTTTAEQDGAPGTIGVTIKYGKGYEDTWFNARGSVEQVRSMVAAYFGMSGEDIAGLTLSEIVINATGLAHAKGNLGGQLGATAIPVSRPKAEKPANGDVWAAAGSESAPAKDDGPTVQEVFLQQIKDVKDVETLKRLWAGNKTVFEDSVLMDAWKARGRELSGK